MALRLSTGLRTSLLSGSKGFKELFADGVIDIYSGTPPVSADGIETGVQLVRISVASGACGSDGTGGGTAGTGVGENGLDFGTAALGSITKNADVWSGTGLATGEAGWYRFYSTELKQGTSGTAIRFDGVCGEAGGNDMVMSDATVTQSATKTIDSFSVTLPAY